ncbi:unnamed protein product [Blepharisma stoltei]|uniref:Guanylate-binding protein N-terminal domain-containing protein n=1 Tax=Blepharisma stoltei TaxID=1481888 RepID=A0AAU9IYN0_9CILI|nr:unnamed protein product [Blepharisma stoltei]
MDLGRPLKLVDIAGPGEMEITTEGISFLQTLTKEIGVICIVGQPSTGKSTLGNKIIGRNDGFETFHDQSSHTQGIWLWSEPLKAAYKDESGLDKEIDLIIMDCQAFTGKLNDNFCLDLEILALASLLSSQLVLCAGKLINEQLWKELGFLSELSNVIQIKKHEDSKLVLSHYLPDLTWVISGQEITESTSNYLEKALEKSAEDPVGIKAIKSNIKRFFTKRACFNFPSLQFESNPNFKESLNSLIDYIKQSTRTKKINGKSIDGAILSNMAQAYVHRFHKQAPAVIYSAFERSVAAEARRNKEKLFIRYLDKIGLIESDLPCEEDNLWKEHQNTSKELLKEFDKTMMSVFVQEEVQEERISLIERIDTYYEELKSTNCKVSEAKCRDAFKSIFDPIRAEGIKFNEEDNTPNIGLVEQKFLAGINEYQAQAAGPMIESVFAEEISFIIPHMSSLLRQLQSHFDTDKEQLESEVKSLSRHRDEARAGEKRLRELLEETNRNYEKQIDQREKQIAELQASVNARVHSAENKSRLQAREIQGLKLELEQSQKEREMMIEAERDRYEKRIGDLESKLYKLQLENTKYEKTLDQLREEHEKTISDKNEQINDLSRRVKLMESQSESPSPRQDMSLLRTFREYLEDIFNKFSKEQSANAKYLGQLERVSSLQNEMNQVRLREQENKNKLIDDYEEKLRQLRLEKDSLGKEIISLNEKMKTQSQNTKDSTPVELEKLKKLYDEKEVLIKRVVEEKNEIALELLKREEQLNELYESVEAYKKQIEQFQIELDDRDNLLNRLKIENVEEKDDNDILISVIGSILEVQQRRKSSQLIHLGRIQNHDNRGKVMKLLKKYSIPFE